LRSRGTVASDRRG